MIREIDLFGIYLSPMVGYALAAVLASVVLRRVLRRLGAYRLVWHPPLFDAALFVIVLAAIVAGVWRLGP
ncbi:MAG: DUF1656 domain-containing protein [Geminicoccaceae bacterium]